MSEEPVLYGAAYSVYVRAARLALEEKAVVYRLVPVDVFAKEGVPADHLARQPFGKIPAFEHRGFRLFETGAITRYVDEAFEGPPLQPASPEGRARMNQVLSIVDAYVYRTLVWDIYVERVLAPRQGRASDETKIAAAMPRARLCLRALEDIMGEGPFLAGERLTLADLHAAPMFDPFTRTRESKTLLADHARLRDWWEPMRQRPSMIVTASA